MLEAEMEAEMETEAEMHKQNKFTVSHAPFWHDGDSIGETNKTLW